VVDGLETAPPVACLPAEPDVPVPERAVLRSDIRQPAIPGKADDLLDAGTHVSLVGDQHVRKLMVDLPASLVLATQSAESQTDPLSVLADAEPIPAADAPQAAATDGAGRLFVTPEEKPAGSSTGPLLK